jgi:glycosyltransferase involved in cell wall biosynthesis
LSIYENISILMSVYNDESRVSGAIESILNQSFKNFEFLILDDFSTDDTYMVCKGYQKKDNRIKLYRNKENIGLTKSLNFLINQSKFDLIARQDADDKSHKYRLEKQVNFMKSKLLDATTTIAEISNLKKRRPFISQFLPARLLINYKNPFIHGTLLIKKETISNLGNYDEKFIYAQDYKLFSDLIKNNYKIKILNKALYTLNIENNISSNKLSEQNYYANCVRKGITP